MPRVPIIEIPDLARIVKEAHDKDFDVIMAVTGRERIGKSTFALHLARALNGRLDLKNHVIYTAGELDQKLNNAKPGTCLVLDESMGALYKREALTGDRRQLNKLFSVVGRRGLAVLLCMPNFNDFDSYYRNWRISLWAHVPARGLGVVMVRNQSPFSGDPWRVKEREAALQNYFVVNGVEVPSKYEMAYGLLAIPHVLAGVRYLKLGEEEARYRKYKEGALEDWGKDESQSGPSLTPLQRQLMLNCITNLRGRGDSWNDIAALFQTTRQNLYQIVESMGSTPKELKARVVRNSPSLGDTKPDSTADSPETALEEESPAPPPPEPAPSEGEIVP